MNLRKTIKVRTFYDDKDYRDPHQDEVYRALPKPAKKPAYQGQVVEYNPDLRPAVFPTIPLGQVVREPVEEVETRIDCESLPTSPIPLEPRAQLTSSTDAPTDAANLLTLTSQNTSQPADQSEQPSQASRSAFDISGMFTSLDHKEWAQRLAFPPGRSPSPDRRTSASCMDNPVFARNMGLMEKLSQRTDEGWAEAEMATSEEEEDDEARGRQMTKPSRPLWDNLPAVMQLDLVDAVMESQTNLDAAFSALRLKTRQKLAILAHLRVRNQYLDEEEQIITEVRDETDRRLLTYGKVELAQFLKSGYKRLIRKHLYAGVGRVDYLTASKQDLSLAKAYLGMCGITLNLDHWASALRSRETETTGIMASIEPLASPAAVALPSVRPGQGAARPSEVRGSTIPMPSTFSMPPRQDAARRTSSVESNTAITNPPTTGIHRAKGLLRLPPRRRRSTQTPARSAQSSSQVNDDFGQVPVNHQEASHPEDIRLATILPDDGHSLPVAREPYIPPPQALPFVLPPQLSHNRQEWLSNGKPPILSVGSSNTQPVPTVPNMLNHPHAIDAELQISAARRGSVSGDASNPRMLPNPQISQNPYRSEHAAEKQFAYNGNVLNDTSTTVENLHRLRAAYERLPQQTVYQGNPPPPPQQQGNPRLASNIPPNAMPPSMNTQLWSSAKPPSATPSLQQNPYAVAYHTANYAHTVTAFSTTQRQYQTPQSQPAEPLSSDTRLRNQQGQEITPDHSTAGSAFAHGRSKKGNGKRPVAQQDEDDDYVPVKKGRKAPAKASNRRQTTVY